MVEKMITPDINNMFSTYHAALTKLENGLDERFEQSVNVISQTGQHVIICGMGKSGLVGRKIAATLILHGYRCSFSTSSRGHSRRFRDGPRKKCCYINFSFW